MTHDKPPNDQDDTAETSRPRPGMGTLPQRRVPSDLTDPLGSTVPVRSVPPRDVSAVDPRGHVGAAACLVPDDPTGQRFLMLDGKPRTVGRSHDNDFVSSDASVSRRHFQIYLVQDTLHDGSPDNRWLVEDVGSSNGTLLGNERLRREAPRPLRDGSVIAAGGRQFTFYRADGEHRPAVRRFLEDPDSLLFNADTVALEIDRLARRGGGAHLALVGIDDYSWIADSLDEVRRQRLLQHVGSQLLAVLQTYDACACLLGVVKPGTFSFFPGEAAPRAPGEVLGAVHSALRESLRRTDSVLREMGITGGQVRASASLVSVGASSAAEVIQRGLDKLRQATNAGGNRISTSNVRPVWDNRRKDLWLTRLPTMKSVALASPGSTGGTLGSDVVLRWVATAIDGLPSGTEVAICLSALPAAWLIAASCGPEELQRVLAKTPDVRIRMADSGPTASRWVEHVEAGLAGAAPGRRQLWVLSQLEADYRSSYEGERLLKAIQGFEGMLRFVGNLTIACLAHARFQLAESARPTLQSATLRKLACSKEEVFPGSSTWLKVAMEIGEILDAGAVPSALGALLADSNWVARCGKAAALRGEHVHGPSAGAGEATAELWACVKRCLSLFVEDDLRIYKVDFVEARRGRRDLWRVHCRRLASAGALGDVEEKEIEGNAVSRGLWAIEGHTRIPLSPLLELERCPDCNRFDLFSAKAIPRKEQAFGMVGLVDRHPRRTRVSEDEPVLWQLLGDLSEGPSGVARSPRDWEITGQFDLARIVEVEESQGATDDPRATLPLDHRRSRGRDDD